MGSVPRINCHLTIVPPLTGVIQYDKGSKGVSSLSYQLPYTLKLLESYPIISNSKAA